MATAMNPYGTEAREVWRMDGREPRLEQPLDSAWAVLEAANDLGDTAAVDACRRVIDANFTGTPACQSDLQVVSDYFQ
jgi:hypothetical protein